MNVGSGDYSYEVIADWAKLPPNWSFQDVAGLAVDSKDRVLVFHRGKHPVIVLSREGEVEGSWGDGVFALAHSIRVGPDRMVYCIDYGDHTVRKLSPEGDVLLTLGNPGKPSPTGAVGFDYRTIQR